jgi:hypothetical protein
MTHYTAVARAENRARAAFLQAEYDVWVALIYSDCSKIVNAAPNRYDVPP